MVHRSGTYVAQGTLQAFQQEESLLQGLAGLKCTVETELRSLLRSCWVAGVAKSASGEQGVPLGEHCGQCLADCSVAPDYV